ncbi:hypothetical protein ILYODFUR_004117 [Ilyodon furcidens]|uniref:Secreted protein n=1 Tax=Ilyodon furcidens TaxID=33524 RepID=A0ABV0T549_9TELE
MSWFVLEATLSTTLFVTSSIPVDSTFCFCFSFVEQQSDSVRFRIPCNSSAHPSPGLLSCFWKRRCSDRKECHV